MDATTREEILEVYDRLSPEERREKIIFSPVYRDAYNELVQPDEVPVGVPHYFWSKWVPILGPGPATVYVIIRDITFKNKKEIKEDAYCFPDQSELAKMCGLSSRKTVRKHLDVLEKNGFMKRDQDYRATLQQAHGGRLARKGTCKYLVYFEIPLISEDAVTLLLIREGFRNSLELNTSAGMGKKSPYGSTGMGKDSPYRDELLGKKDPPTESYPQESTGTGNSCGQTLPNYNVRKNNVVSTLDNVREHSSFSNGSQRRPSAFRSDPRISKLSGLEKAQKEELVKEIALRLNSLTGDHGNHEHKSAGYHRWIAYLMPAHFVMEALTTVQDQHYEAREGRATLGDPGGYFVGVIRRMAEKEGIDLGPVTARRS